MIVGLTGVIAGNITSYPPYGTFLSQTCTYTTIVDAVSNSFSGYYNSHKVYADGMGGTYASDDIGVDSCYYPYGYYLSYSQYTFDVPWSGCSSSGTLSMAGTWQYSQMADGAGGWISTDSPVGWNYMNGYYLYDDGYCRVTLDTSTSPWYAVDNYGGGGGGGYPAYGTKIGDPYWNSGVSALWQNYADGMGGSYSGYWDNNPPYPPNGTQISDTTSGCWTELDARGTGWWLCFYSTYYGDGYGGSYINNVLIGYYPNGFALSADGVNYSDYDYSFSLPDDSYNYIYPYRYGYSSADGYGGSYFQNQVAPYGTNLSPSFYCPWYGWYGNIYSDGYGGYFFT